MDYNFETVCFILVSLSAGIHQLRRYMIHSSLMHSFVFKLAGIFEIWTATRGNERKMAEKMGSWILYTFTFQANLVLLKNCMFTNLLKFVWNTRWWRKWLHYPNWWVNNTCTPKLIFWILIGSFPWHHYTDSTTFCPCSTQLYHGSSRLYLTLPWL